MGNNLYWVSTLTYAAALTIILLNDIRMKEKANAEERAFRLMAGWIIFFSLQDAVWGLCESGVLKGDAVFFASSTVFHLSTVITTLFWLYYVCVYIGERIGKKYLYLGLDAIVVMFEVALVIANYYTPTLFYIKNGEYYTGPLRALTFHNQNIVYMITAIATLVVYVRHKTEITEEKRDRYFTVFVASLAPILMGIAQLAFVDGPFYSLGYFFSCFIVHVFVVAKDRAVAEKRYENELEKKSHYDELTGLYNRRAFDEDVAEIMEGKSDDKLAFISIDVNELKIVNDNLGHAAGDEMLKGAADCMKRCFSIYGKVFRTGGDEFNAILYVSEMELVALIRDFREQIRNWSGQHVEKVSVSCGYVMSKEFAEGTIKEMIALADERMYADKAEFYKHKGVDRRGQRDAHTALCALYTKILKVNLTEDSFQIVNMDEYERVASKGFNDDKISSWLLGFAGTGQVHPDDVANYLFITSLSHMREHFKSGKSSLSVIYRRKIGEEYKRVQMEMIPANDYADTNQSIYLYVKSIED